MHYHVFYDIWINSNVVNYRKYIIIINLETIIFKCNYSLNKLYNNGMLTMNYQHKEECVWWW